MSERPEDRESMAFEAVLREVRRAQLRAKWTQRLREEKGDAWVEDNQALLSLQFEYLKDCNFI